MERLPEKEAHSVSRGYSLNFHADSFSPPFLVSARLKRLVRRSSAREERPMAKRKDAAARRAEAAAR